MVWRPVTLPKSAGETVRVAVSPHRGLSLETGGGDRCSKSIPLCFSILTRSRALSLPKCPTRTPPAEADRHARAAQAPCPTGGLPGEGLPARRGQDPPRPCWSQEAHRQLPGLAVRGTRGVGASCAAETMAGAPKGSTQQDRGQGPPHFPAWWGGLWASREASRLEPQGQQSPAVTTAEGLGPESPRALG